MTSTDTTQKYKGEVLNQIYRVWLFRKLVPVVIIEIVVLAIILFQLGKVVFVQRVFENALNILFANPGQIFAFTTTTFLNASLSIKLFSIVVLFLLALLIRHLTQGLLRLILVRENYFSKIQK